MRLQLTQLTEDKRERNRRRGGKKIKTQQKLSFAKFEKNETHFRKQNVKSFNDERQLVFLTNTYGCLLTINSFNHINSDDFQTVITTTTTITKAIAATTSHNLESLVVQMPILVDKMYSKHNYSIS